MSIELNHTLVLARDKAASAGFLADILGRPAPMPFGCFLTVEMNNGVTLGYLDDDREIVPTHYVFLVSEPEFDYIFARICGRGLPYWADPMHRQPNAINRHDGGRGIFFDDPNGQRMEIITRPYGSGG